MWDKGLGGGSSVIPRFLACLMGNAEARATESRTN